MGTTIKIGSKQFGIVNQGKLSQDKGKGPFVVSGLNAVVPGVVSTFFSQFSFQIPFDALLTDLRVSIDGATAAGINVPVPSLTVSITQPSASNPGLLAVGTFVSDLYFSSVQQFISYTPAIPLFVSGSKTLAVNINARFGAALGAADNFRVGAVLSFV